MESSKNFDIPPVLKPDFERRLVRVFAFLRQHDRKARLAKKIAELNALKDEPKRTPPAVVFSGNVVQGPQHDSCENQPEAVSSPTPTHNVTAEHTRETVVKILEDEIEELRKTINFKDFDTTGSISASDLSSAFRALNRPTPKAEVLWMMWEVDDDVDGCIDWDEFRGAYARCVADKQCAEPSQLFHLIQFLLSDADGGATVSVADIKAELQRIRGTDHLITRIKKALGVSTEQQEQERHALGPYLDAMLASLPTSLYSGSHLLQK